MATARRVTRKRWMLVALAAAMLLVAPAAASARHWHRGHHHHHHHGHWGHWHGHHHVRSYGYYGGARFYGYRPWSYGPRYYGGYYGYGYPAFGYSSFSYASPYFGINIGYGLPVGYSSYYYAPCYSSPIVSYGSYYYLSQSTPLIAPSTYVDRTLVRRDPVVIAARSTPAARSAPTRLAAAAKPAMVDRTTTRTIAARTVAAKPVAPAARVVEPLVAVSLKHDAISILRSGDTAFQGRRYRNAAEFYKLAAETVPNDSQVLLRAGYALAAQGLYRDAYPMLAAAVEHYEGDVGELVSLRELYADERDRAAHLEALAKSALEHSDNGPLMAMVGLFLLHDGQAARAQPFFAEAQRLTGGEELISGRVSIAPRHVAMDAPLTIGR